MCRVFHISTYTPVYTTAEASVDFRESSLFLCAYLNSTLRKHIIIYMLKQTLLPLIHLLTCSFLKPTDSISAQNIDPSL
jgi:hypothetical protein